MQDRAILHAEDSRGFTPIHIACLSTHDEGPDIVDIILDVRSARNVESWSNLFSSKYCILQVDPLAARRRDNLGQLPLHLGDCTKHTKLLAPLQCCLHTAMLVPMFQKTPSPTCIRLRCLFARLFSLPPFCPPPRTTRASVLFFPFYGPEPVSLPFRLRKVYARSSTHPPVILLSSSFLPLP